MAQSLISAEEWTRTGQGDESRTSLSQTTLDLDLKKYAPLLERAGVAPDAHERYLRELTGIVHAILDAYFEDLQERKPDP